MCGLLPPCRTPYAETFVCAQSSLGKVKQRAEFQHHISMHHAVMRICISHRLTIKGTTLRECASVDVSHVKIGSTAWALGGNFGYTGRSNLWGDLDHMWRVGRYGGRNHVCNIWWLSVKGCGCGATGKFALSHWLDASPLQHWSHYHVTVWSSNPNEMTIFRRGPPNRGVECIEVWKMTIIDQYVALYRNWCKIEP